MQNRPTPLFLADKKRDVDPGEFLPYFPKDGMNVLLAAIHSQNPAAIEALISTAKAKTLHEVVALQDNCYGYGSTLNAAAGLLDPANFKMLLARLSLKAINKAIRLRYPNDSCILQIAVCSQDSVSFQALLSAIPEENLEQSLRRFNHMDECLLYAAAQYQDSAAFQALIAKASREAIDQTLALPAKRIGKGKGGWSALHIAARYQPSAAFQALIAKASQDTIDRALLLKTPNHWTVLGLAAYHQHSTAFQALVAKASPAAISQSLITCTATGKPSFESIARNLSPDSMRFLLQRLTPSADVLDTFFFENPGSFFKVLAQFSSQQPIENTLDFLSLLTQETLEMIANYLIYYKENPSFLPSLLALTTKVERLYQKELETVAEQLSPYIKQDSTSFSSPFALAAKAERLLAEKPVHILKKSAFYQSLEKLAANQLKKVKSQYKDVPNEEEDYEEEDKQLIKSFTGSTALVKIIGNASSKASQDTHWNELLDALKVKDYSKRQNFRDPKKPPVGYKYFHIASDEEDEKNIITKGKIVPFSQEEQKLNKRNKTYKGLVKTAATVISSDLTTSLFGAHTNDPLVGLAFHQEKCCFRAMLLQDRSTYHRAWVNENSNAVHVYAQSIQHISHTNLTQYREAIDNRPYTLNEALVEVNRDAIQGMIIGTDTDEARDIALRRKEELERLLKRKIPIIFYNPLIQHIRVFTKKTQLFHKDKKMLRELLTDFPIQATKTKIELEEKMLKLQYSNESLPKLFLLLDEYLSLPLNDRYFSKQDTYENLLNLWDDLRKRLREEMETKLNRLKKNATLSPCKDPFKEKWLNQLLTKIISLHHRGYKDSENIRKMLALFKVYHLFKAMDWDQAENTIEKIQHRDILAPLNTFSNRHGTYAGAWIKQALFGRKYGETMSASRLMVENLIDHIRIVKQANTLPLGQTQLKKQGSA